MQRPNPDFRDSPPQQREDRAADWGPGIHGAKRVSGEIGRHRSTEDSGMRDRVDATRSRRRYITH